MFYVLQATGDVKGIMASENKLAAGSMQLAVFVALCPVPHAVRRLTSSQQLHFHEKFCHNDHPA